MLTTSRKARLGLRLADNLETEFRGLRTDIGWTSGCATIPRYGRLSLNRSRWRKSVCSRAGFPDL